jgi:L-seryl-tRNA(Ser) seleniumtransferase
LRLGQPAVVGRIEEDRFLLDPRTVMPEQEETLIERVRLALT